MDEVLVKYTNKYSRFMVVNGNLLHYRDEGKGYPIVMLHGAFSSLHTFNAWANILKTDFRIIRYDLPGFGLTGKVHNDDYGMKNHLGVLRTLLDNLGIDRCVLVGNSLGGWLAWEFTLLFPNRVRKLVLMDSAGFLDADSVPTPFKMAKTPFMNRVVKYVVRKNVLEQFIYQVYHDAEQVTPELIDRYYELFTREGNPEAFMYMVNKAKFKDNTHKIKKIGCPTLVMWGEEDKWIPLSNAHKFLNAIPRARLVIYEDVGHLPMEESAEETAQELRRFILGGGEQSNLFEE